MSASIGAALRAGREQRRLTLAQVSESTRIRAHYLQALENDDLSAMPSAAQGRGFMRIYANFLGLDLEALIPSPAPAAVLAPEAPTTPVHAAAPQEPSPEPHTQAKLPALLNDLRERIGRRLARRSAQTESNEAADSASTDDSAAKKKASH